MSCPKSYLSLKKSFFFPSRVEFVGHGVCDNGNRPAQSKGNLLKTWPKFQTVRDVASFISYILFNAPYLLNAEVHMTKLRERTKLLYANQVDSIVTKERYEERDDLIASLLADPCLACYDPNLRSFLSTDFSAEGMGYVFAQPSCDTKLLTAMSREIAGGIYDFLDDHSKARLRTVAFGSSRLADARVNYIRTLGRVFAMIGRNQQESNVALGSPLHVGYQLLCP